ncbi:hypothetical protein B0A50_08676 [Salinomyces thailandicus]|uniref:Uncharacterized protein n=1 Tax=Salinomyces thailandicus TaxID=706561 RepID=A0A4V5N320_9PEZI|nr:hypothetical protein B0A50_08676 [Salinomyces thailandica]
MIDPTTGIEVRVKPDGSGNPYREYSAPRTSRLRATGRNETLIDAVTDARYVVEVIIHPTFRWRKAPNVPTVLEKLSEMESSFKFKELSEHKWIPEWILAKGSVGERMTFTFYYTTGEYLKINGIVSMSYLFSVKSKGKGGNPKAEEILRAKQFYNSLKLSNVEDDIKKKMQGLPHPLTDAASASVNHLSNEHINAEEVPEAHNGAPEATGAEDESVTLAGAKGKRKQVNGKSNEEPAQKRAKENTAENTHNATSSAAATHPEPALRAVPQASPHLRTVSDQYTKARRKAVLQRRLEELRIERELEELENED